MWVNRRHVIVALTLTTNMLGCGEQNTNRNENDSSTWAGVVRTDKPSSPPIARVIRGPGREQPRPDEASEPRTRELVGALTSSGKLTVLSSKTGQTVGSWGSGCTDLLADDADRSRLFVACQTEDGEGTVHLVSVLGNSITTTSVAPWQGGDYRMLLRSGTWKLDLQASEDTELVLGEGDDSKSVAAIGSWAATDRGAWWQVTTLETWSTGASLSRYRVTSGRISLESESTLPVTPSCSSRIVRQAPMTTLAWNGEQGVQLLDETGSPFASLGAPESDSRCVEDAVWIPARQQVVVLTGPTPRVRWVDTKTGASGETELAGHVWHDPLPRRRLTLSPGSKHLWITTSERLTRCSWSSQSDSEGWLIDSSWLEKVGAETVEVFQGRE